MSLDAVYVTYWSLNDPLCRSQTLPVVRGLARRGWRLALLTFEQKAWAMDPAERDATRADLEREGIQWVGLPYHKWPSLLSTLFDIACGVLRCLALAWRPGVRLFHGRATVASAIAFLAAGLSGRLFFNDADGPLSEEYADVGIWKRESAVHKLVRWAERMLVRRAQAVAVLSDNQRVVLQPLTPTPIQVLPCAVDTAHFRPLVSDRASAHAELGLVGTVFVYAGKWGGWYSSELMFDFLAEARTIFERLSLLVLTIEASDRFQEASALRGIPCTVRRATRDEMPGYLAQAHVALSFVRTLPSKMACSPVKNGEYLACGLPVVTTPNIGDYSSLISRERVGVTLAGISRGDLQNACLSLQELLREPGLSDRCRSVACREVGLDEVVLPRYFRTYEHLLGRPSTERASRDS
jgi:glycosyltransferase involved in cell wall biosynthesis